MKVVRSTKDQSGYHLQTGWEWVDPNDPKNLRVSVKAGLVRDSFGNFGLAPGYIWVDKPNLTVRVRPGLVRDPDGTFRLARGYIWTIWTDKAVLAVALAPGLFRTEGGFVPAFGYMWARSGDNSDLEAKLIQNVVSNADGSISPRTGV